MQLMLITALYVHLQCTYLHYVTKLTVD